MTKTLLARAGRAWLDIRTRVARWIDPVDWDDLARPKTQAEIAETELRLWLAAPVTEASDEGGGDFELTAEMRDHMDVQRAKVLNAGPPVLAQRMRRVRRRRRVRIGIVLALAALFLLATAGIREVGIRPVDAFLGLDDGDPTSGIQQVPSLSGRPDTSPKLYSASERLLFPWGPGESWEMLAYVATSGDKICSSLGPSPRLEGDPLSMGGCVSMADLSHRLSRKPITSIGLLGGENLVVKGYVADDVTEVLVDGPRGDMEAYLSEVWTPDLPDARPFRMFVALTRLLKPGKRLMAKQTDRLMDYRLYRFEVFLDNGSSVVANADEL